MGDSINVMGDEIVEAGDQVEALGFEFEEFMDSYFGTGGSADQAMEESYKTLRTLEEMIRTFCQEGRRLDGHKEGEAHHEDDLCMEARMQYGSAVRTARSAMEEQRSTMSGSLNDVRQFFSNGSTFYVVGAATLSAAATLAF